MINKRYSMFIMACVVAALALLALQWGIWAKSNSEENNPEEGWVAARWSEWEPEPVMLNNKTDFHETPWALPATAWRIGITQDGLYRLTRESLLAAGVPLTTPSAYHLWWRGQEVALDEIGFSNSAWNAGDGFVFYAEKFKGSTQDEKYTAENVYWLTIDGSWPGKRMATRTVEEMNTGTPGLCWANLLFEQNLTYWARWSTTPGTDTNWFWERVTGSSTKPVTKTYTLAFTPELSSGEQATLEIEFAAGQEVYNLNPDHHVRLLLNNTVIGDIYWEGKTGTIQTVNFPVELLRSGNNTFQWVIMNDPGMGTQIIYFDRAVFRYPTRPQVSNSLALCTKLGSGTGVYTFTGYSELPSVYDVRVITDVQRLSGYTATGNGVVFQDSTATARYAVGIPVAITPTQTTLRTGEILNPQQGADYVIVVPTVWETAVQSLAEHRAAQGLRVKIVRIEDIYALFNGGIVHPQALQNFIKYAYQTWPSPALQMVFLVGDGDFNPKGYNPAVYGDKKPTWIVPYLQFVDPDQGEVATDPMYGDVNGDGYAEVAIGRLPAETLQEVTAYIGKVLAYEQAPQAGWQTEALLMADDGETFYEPFREMIERVHNRYAPTGVISRTVYAQTYCGAIDYSPCPSMTRAITEAWNLGQGLVVYSGHGAVYRWGHEPLILNRQFATLTETQKLPFLVSLDCWDGYWMFPAKYHSWPGNSYRSVGEWVSTVLTDRGAIAAYGPAGLAYPSVQEVMLDAMWKSLYREGEFQLGPLVQRGWKAIQLSYLAKTYNLLGDPGLWLPYWSGLTVSPTGWTVEAGRVISIPTDIAVFGTTRFAQLLDVTHRVRWQDTMGNIDAWNVWHAPTQTGQVSLTARLGTLSATLPVTIVHAAPITLTVTPNPLVLVVGQQTTLSASLVDAYGNPWSPPTIEWTTNIGDIDASGRFTAPIHPATGWLTATSGTFTTRVPVHIGSGEPNRLVIVPEALTITVGQTHQFNAKIEDEYGNTLPWSEAFVWSADDTVGAITSSGLFTAKTTPGTGYVRVQSDSFSAQAPVTVTPGASNLVQVTPEVLTTTVGMLTSFQAQALDSYGNPTSDPITWIATVGVIDEQGRFTAPTYPTRGWITATAGTAKTTVPVTVLAGAPASLTLTPNRITLRVRQSVMFNAQIRDQYGNLILDVQPEWTATCGSVNAEGGYTAPAHPCHGTVMATVGAVSATAEVEIRAAIYLPLALRNVFPTLAGPPPFAGVSYLK